MSITSTVPAAVSVLLAYMNAVSAANPTMHVKVYMGRTPTSAVANNFMMVGNFPDGELIMPGRFSWAAIPGQDKLRREEYALNGVIRSWTGDSAEPLARLADVYTMLNGLHGQIANDLAGTALGLTVTPPAVAGQTNLSPSGSWGDLNVEMLENGPAGKNGGWTVMLGFELAVINAQIIG